MRVRKKTKAEASHMNQHRYQLRAKRYFKSRVARCWGRAKPSPVLLVLDRERCLWVLESVETATAWGAPA